MPTPTPFKLSDAERGDLDELARSRRGRADEARRARIILLLAEGYSYSTISERVDCTAQTIATWKARYQAHGINGLRGRHRGSKPRVLTPKVEARYASDADFGARIWDKRLFLSISAISLILTLSVPIMMISSLPAQSSINRCQERIGVVLERPSFLS